MYTFCVQIAIIVQPIKCVSFVNVNACGACEINAKSAHYNCCNLWTQQIYFDPEKCKLSDKNKTRLLPIPIKMQSPSEVKSSFYPFRRIIEANDNKLASTNVTQMNNKKGRKQINVEKRPHSEDEVPNRVWLWVFSVLLRLLNAIRLWLCNNENPLSSNYCVLLVHPSFAVNQFVYEFSATPISMINASMYRIQMAADNDKLDVWHQFQLDTDWFWQRKTRQPAITTHITFSRSISHSVYVRFVKYGDVSVVYLMRTH